MRFAPFSCLTQNPVGAGLLARVCQQRGCRLMHHRQQAGSYRWAPPYKSRATEVAQNALRAHCIKKDLRFFPLVRILPDKKSKPREVRAFFMPHTKPCRSRLAGDGGSATRVSADTPSPDQAGSYRWALPSKSRAKKKGNRSCPKCLACSLHQERPTVFSACANPSR